LQVSCTNAQALKSGGREGGFIGWKNFLAGKSTFLRFLVWARYSAIFLSPLRSRLGN